MTTFYICRHGETQNNKARRLSGWADTPLTEEGKQNAADSGAKLKGIHIDKLVSSDLGRTISTAKIVVNQIGYLGQVEKSQELREVNYGDLANAHYTEYPDIPGGDNTNFVHPGGESPAQMQTRVVAKLMELAKDNPDKTIVIVAHGGTIHAIKATYTDTSIGIVDKDRSNHHSVFRFTIENGKITSFEEI